MRLALLTVAAALLLASFPLLAAEAGHGSSVTFHYAHSALYTHVYALSEPSVLAQGAGGPRLAYFVQGEGDIGTIDLGDAAASDGAFEWFVGRSGVTEATYAGIEEPEGICASGVARRSVVVALPEGCDMLGFRLGTTTPLDDRCDEIGLYKETCRIMLGWRVGAEQTTGFLRVAFESS